MVDQPWGRMFYEMIFKQLNITNDKRIRILDFGAGFCITANHYANNYDVVAVEPNEEMYSLRVEEKYHGRIQKDCIFQPFDIQKEILTYVWRFLCAEFVKE